jgi:hypothetical protein
MIRGEKLYSFTSEPPCAVLGIFWHKIVKTDTDIMRFKKMGALIQCWLIVFKRRCRRMVSFTTLSMYSKRKICNFKCVHSNFAPSICLNIHLLNVLHWLYSCKYKYSSETRIAPYKHFNLIQYIFSRIWVTWLIVNGFWIG